MNKLNDFLCRKQGVVLLFPAGFVCGIILGVFAGKIEAVKEIVTFSISLLSDVSLYYPLLLCYVATERFKNFMFLVVCSFLPVGPHLFSLGILFFGGVIGIVFACYACCKGFSGIFFCLMSGFPHFIFYALFCYFGYELFLSVWLRLQKSDLRGQFVRGGYVCIMGLKMNRIAFLIVVAIMGILSECYVNPFILKLCTKFIG